MAKSEKNMGWSGFFMVFTVFSAILMLLAQQGQPALAPGNGDWQVLSVYEGLTRWTVPALFMLWGMHALESGKPSFTGTMTGLVLPCFCMLVFWGALYAIAGHLLSGGTLSWRGLWNALVAAARGQSHFHLWLLYPLMGLYLVHPVLHRFTASASQAELRYFLALSFLFASLMPVLRVFYPHSALVQLLQRLQIHLVLGYIGCYVAGWYLHRYTIGRTAEFILYLLGILGTALTLLGDRIFGGGRSLWYGFTAPGVVLTAAALCVLFRYVLGVSDERSRRRSVSELGRYAFGVYLFHQIWVLIFDWFDLSILVFTPVLSVPFFALVFFLISIPFAWLLYLIPGAGRWLV